MPHSEIHGSKVILTSPWLIAEYHVLHRLLLPRHPPNALFALDLIQKKQDRDRLCPTAFSYLSALPLSFVNLGLTEQSHDGPFVLPSLVGPRIPAAALPGQKSYISHPAAGSTTGHVWLVYLTWNKTAFRYRLRSTKVLPHAEEPAVLMFLSLYDVNSSLRIRLLRASKKKLLKLGTSFQCCLQQHHPGPTLGRFGFCYLKAYSCALPSDRRSKPDKARRRAVRQRQTPVSHGGSRRTRTSDLTLIRRAL